MSQVKRIPIRNLKPRLDPRNREIEKDSALS
jgi:hypothetical protein